MRTLTHPTQPATTIEDQLADILARLSDVVRLLGRPAPPRLVAPAAPADELLTRAEAAALLKVSLSKLDRFTRGKACRRRVGGQPRFEKAALLALVRGAR